MLPSAVIREYAIIPRKNVDFVSSDSNLTKTGNSNCRTRASNSKIETKDSNLETKDAYFMTTYSNSTNFLMIDTKFTSDSNLTTDYSNSKRSDSNYVLIDANCKTDSNVNMKDLKANGSRFTIMDSNFVSDSNLNKKDLNLKLNDSNLKTNDSNLKTKISRHSKLRTKHRVSICVSGTLYETTLETLNRYPDTLLGNKQRLSPYFCSHRNEYFFERHRESFASILFFYQSPGKLYRPDDINLKVFLEECEFFELPRCAIDNLKRKEGGFLEDDIIAFWNQKEPEELTLKENIWLFFDDPSVSRLARYFAYFSVFALIVSITINCWQTVPKGSGESEHHDHDVWEIVDTVINAYFLIEFSIRLIVSPSKFKFFQSVLVWIDFIALISFIPAINTHYANTSVILFFTPFQLFRVVRIFRLAKLLPEYNIAEIIVNDCIGYFRMFLTWTVFVGMVAAVILYVFEEHEYGSSILSAFDGFYWAIQTFMTVGYGDVIPITLAGKVSASFFMLGFVPTLCIPTLTVLIRFSKFYEFSKAIADDEDEGVKKG